MASKSTAAAKAPAKPKPAASKPKATAPAAAKAPADATTKVTHMGRYGFMVRYSEPAKT